MSHEGLFIGRDGAVYVDGYPSKKFKSSSGYDCVRVPHEHNPKFVHRLVAEEYLPNPNNCKIVNHINGIKTDNSVGNLEWCTQSENIKRRRIKVKRWT